MKIKKTVVLSIFELTITTLLIATPIYANTNNPQPISVEISTLEYNEDTLSNSLNNKWTLKFNKALNQSFVLSKAISLSACIYLPNEGLWSDILSVDDLANNTSITGQSKFHAGSIGKLATAALILRLIEKNQLSLNTKIDRWFSDTLHSDIISIENLLNHTSGLASHFVDAPLDVTSKDKAIRALNDNLMFTTGTGFTYSNPGYIILGLILEQEYKQPLAQILQTHFIQELSLNETNAITTSNTNATLVGNANHNEFNYAKIGGAGIIASTPCDLIRILNAFLANKIINEKTLKEMEQKAYPMNFEGTLHWTRGLMFLDTPLGKVHFLNGKIAGFRSSIIYHPELNIFISIMANNEDTQTVPIIFHLLKVFEREQ